MGVDQERCGGEVERLKMAYPTKLQEIVQLFEHLPEEEKRESLVCYSLTTKIMNRKMGRSLIWRTCGRTKSARIQWVYS